MCEISDLTVMMVESDDKELKTACESLECLGIKKIICVSSYDDAIDMLDQEERVDIVIADYNITDDKELGLLLCVTIKRLNPSTLVVLMSDNYSCSIVFNSFSIQADDILDKKREGDISKLMKKWIELARQKRVTREVLNGATTTTTKKAAEY